MQDDNKVLTDRVQALEYSKITQSNRIKSLEIDIKNLEESNKQLVDSNNQRDKRIEALELEIKELKETNKVINNKKDKLTNYILQMNSNYEKLADDKNLLKEEKDKLIAENKNLKIKIETSNKEIKQLKQIIVDKTKLNEYLFNDYLSENIKHKLEIAKLKK